MNPRTFAASFSFVCATTLVAGPSLAELTKDQCLTANGDAQSLRKEGKLMAAEEQLQACASPECPAILRDDCSRRLDELLSVRPTIIFEVKDAAGKDLQGAVISVDGKSTGPRKDGAALPGDIGSHVFTITVPGYAPATRTLVLTEGEKGRRELVTLGGPPADDKTAPPSPPPAAGSGSKKTIGLVLGGVGLAGIAAGTVFGVMALSEKSAMNRDCPGGACPNPTAGQADHSSATTDGLISTIGFAAGGALLVTGTILFVMNGGHEDTKPASAWTVTPSVAPTFAGMLLHGEF